MLDWREREEKLLAPWAMHAADSAGRVHDEPPHVHRSPYQRDRDRIVHAAAFRRLAHKTQVFTDYHGDYHRSRLTHTLEVTSIARTMARALALNEDLVETLAMGHDIGHPPLGHAGEDTLNALLSDEGGFSHNAQALRIMELLENRYPEFPGLNLTREVLGAQMSRCEKSREHGRLLESQVVDAADSIAYDTHDADDAIELGLVELNELLELPLVKAASERVRERFGELAAGQLRRAVLHDLVNVQVVELIDRTQRYLEEHTVRSTADVLAATTLVTHSPKTSEGKRQLERFLFERVYRSPVVMAVREPAQTRLSQLFEWLVARPDAMPARFLERARQHGVRRTVADYIAGMTDRFLEREHARRCG
ncbi:MAG: dGTP triphosphohydrolase [Pirellulales bacterium]|jgi:dGTPase